MRPLLLISLVVGWQWMFKRILRIVAPVANVNGCAGPPSRCGNRPGRLRRYPPLQGLRASVGDGRWRAQQSEFPSVCRSDTANRSRLHLRLPAEGRPSYGQGQQSVVGRPVPTQRIPTEYQRTIVRRECTGRPCNAARRFRTGRDLSVDCRRASARLLALRPHMVDSSGHRVPGIPVATTSPSKAGGWAEKRESTTVRSRSAAQS